MPHAAVLIPVAVVDGLDASSARRVILGRGDLELAIVRKRSHALHQTLAISPGSENRGPVEVLEGSGDNFRRGCRARIHQDDNWNLRIHRLPHCPEYLLRMVLIALGGNHDRALGHEERDNVDSLLEKAAAIAAKVKDEFLHSLSLQFQVCIADILGNPLGEAGLENVAGSVVEHPGILHVRKMNPLPDNPDLDCVTLFPAVPAKSLLHAENHRSARIALHPGCRLVSLEPLHGLSVDGHDLVPAAESRIGRRRAGIRLIDNDIALSIRLVDNRPDTSVCLADHELEVLIVLLRHIHRIWVEGLQHCIDSRTLDSVHRQGIHIRPVQFLDDGILDLGPFPESETG